MNRPTFWGMAAVLALCAAGAGCAQNLQTVRGQSPVPQPTADPTCPVPDGTAVGAATAGPLLGPFIGSAPGYAEGSKHAGSKPWSHHDFKTLPQMYNNNFGFEGGYYTGPEGYYTNPSNYAYAYGGAGGAGCPSCQPGGPGGPGAAGGCPSCQYGASCPPGGCPACGFGCPHHHMTYQYNWPRNLVYPAPVVPAGMVQWPYYTLRGPSDFFYWPISQNR